MSASWIPLVSVVAVISVICYRLMGRRPSRRWSSDGGGDVSSTGGNSGWSLADWFGSSAPTDNSGASGGWDSGGDSGGGGGGDGGSGD